MCFARTLCLQIKLIPRMRAHLSTVKARVPAGQRALTAASFLRVLTPAPCAHPLPCAQKFAFGKHIASAVEKMSALHSLELAAVLEPLPAPAAAAPADAQAA
jgi:hypothetical protein